VLSLHAIISAKEWLSTIALLVNSRLQYRIERSQHIHMHCPFRAGHASGKNNLKSQQDEKETQEP
jgi:hypothetical protein